MLINKASGSATIFHKVICIALASFYFILLSCASEDKRPIVTDPEKSLKEAIDLIDDKEYDEARDILNEIKHVDTSRTFAPLAQLKIAESYALDEEDDLAIVEYKRFLEQYPDSQFAAYTQFQIASLYFGQIRSPERGAGAAKFALQEYKTLQELYPRNPYKDIVITNMQKCRDTIAAYEFQVGKFYFKKGSYKGALGRFTIVLENYPDFVNMDAVLYHLSLTYKYMDDPDNASKYFNELKKRFPGSSLVEELSEELSDD